MTGVGVVVLAAITCLYLVRYQGLARTPWTYVSVAAALLAALFALGITLVEAKLEDDLTSKERRLDGARRTRLRRRDSRNS